MWNLFKKNKETKEKKKLTYSYSVNLPKNKYTLLESTSLCSKNVDENTYIPRIGEKICIDYNGGDPDIFKFYAEVTDVFYNIPLNFICIQTKAYAMDAFVDGTKKYIRF